MEKTGEGRVWVFTFKDGVLARAAHDLRLSIERFEVRTDGERVEAEFRPDSLRVDGSMHDERLEPDELSEGDKRQILKNARADVLGGHEEIRFEGRAAAQAQGRRRISGSLTMAGRTQPVELLAELKDGNWCAETELQPSRWGIKPYKALLGAIKLKDRILVRFELPNFL